MIVKARPGGPNYVYAILTGYKDPPPGFNMLSGMNYNEYFPGHQIAMPPPLSDNIVTFADGVPASVPQMAHDVVSFLELGRGAQPRRPSPHRAQGDPFLDRRRRRVLRDEAQDLGTGSLTARMAGAVIGIIGGSGLDQIDGLADVEWRRVESPFGRTSDEFCFGTLDGQPVVFVPRHGRGHVLPPSEINFRANIDALKRCGVTEIVSLSAVGSLREELAPGDFVVIDQFIDRTFRTGQKLFRKGLCCPCVDGRSGLRPDRRRIDRGRDPSAGMTLKRGGTYLVMEGPQFSSLAESELYRSWKCDVIGMTNMPEAKLAREAEICYATVAMVTDYDCWHPGHDAVTVDMIVGVLLANAEKAKTLIRSVVPLLAVQTEPCRQGCQRALDQALITAPERRDPELLARLDAVAGRVLGGSGQGKAGERSRPGDAHDLARCLTGARSKLSIRRSCRTSS